jgi:hypothetical protein
MISMANEKGKPTDKQIAALRKFRISESEIQAMSFSQASSRLDELIGQARARKQGQQRGAGGGSNGSSAGAGGAAEVNAPEEDAMTTSRGSSAPGQVHAPALPISDEDAIAQQGQQRQQQQQQHEQHPPPPRHPLPVGSEEETYDVDQEMLESKGFIEQHFMGDYARSELVAEHARQKFAIFMAKMIQKNKQSNMERISKD